MRVFARATLTELGHFGGTGARGEPGAFYGCAHSIATDSRGNVYVSEIGGGSKPCRVQRFLLQPAASWRAVEATDATAATGTAARVVANAAAKPSAPPLAAPKANAPRLLIGLLALAGGGVIAALGVVAARGRRGGRAATRAAAAAAVIGEADGGMADGHELGGTLGVTTTTLGGDEAAGGGAWGLNDAALAARAAAVEAEAKVGAPAML